MSPELTDWFIGVSQSAGWDLVKTTGTVVLYRILATTMAGSVPTPSIPLETPESKFEDLLPTEQIATRLKVVIGEFGKLDLRDEDQTLSITKLAELLGHKDLGILQGVLSNGIPLAFEDAHRICDLLGINENWLLEGTSTPFLRYPLYSNPLECAAAHLTSDNAISIEGKYSTYYFVLRDGKDGQADVYARLKDNPFKFDLLLQGVPIRENVGTTGQGQIVDFCAYCTWVLPQGPLSKLGRRISAADHLDLVNGIKHPSWLVPSWRNVSLWHEDIGDIEFNGNGHGEGYQFAHQFFVRRMHEKGIPHTDEVVSWFHSRISRDSAVARRQLL
jgi:hypothetical protein